MGHLAPLEADLAPKRLIECWAEKPLSFNFKSKRTTFCACPGHRGATVHKKGWYTVYLFIRSVVFFVKTVDLCEGKLGLLDILT